jgi:hypothetical protein
VIRPRHTVGQNSPIWRDAPWFPSWTFDGFLQHPNAGTGARVALGKFKMGGTQNAFQACDDASELSIRAAAWIKVIPGFGYLLDCRAVDLPSPAGNTNNPLKAVIVWRPILSSSNSQASRSCHCDE